MDSLNSPRKGFIANTYRVDIQSERDNIVKGFLEGSILLPTVDEMRMLEKGHKSGLTQKRVTIKMKDGTTYQAIRWVNPDSGLSSDVSGKHKGYINHPEGETSDDRIQNITSSEGKTIGKVRQLVSEVVYDQKTLAKLSGHKYPGDIGPMVKREVDVNTKEFAHPNETLPQTEEEANGLDLDKEDNQRMAISEIQEHLGNAKAREAQKLLKDELIKSLGITVEDKWNSYENNIEMLLDGDLGLRAVIGYGVGGIGKTYTFEKLAEQRKMIGFEEEYDMERGSDEYDFVKLGGKIGSRETQRAMYEHRDKLIIFDDLDSIWEDKGLINVLKNTLDTSGNGKCQWAQKLPETSKGAGDTVPSTFKFNGKMIFITNLTKKDFQGLGATPITDSRAASTDLTMNMPQTLKRLREILPFITLKDSNREKMVDVELSDKEIALDALDSMAAYATLDQLNTRVLSGIIAKARKQRRDKGEYNLIDLQKELVQQFGIA